MRNSQSHLVGLQSAVDDTEPLPTLPNGAYLDLRYLRPGNQLTGYLSSNAPLMRKHELLTQ